MKTRLSVVAGPLLLLVVALVTPPAQAAPNAAADKAEWHTPKPPYPAEAHDRHLQGQGTLRLRTDAGGRVIEARMDPSTGSRVLDEVSVQFVRTYWHGPPNRRHSTVLNYRLFEYDPSLQAYYRTQVVPIVRKHWTDSMKTRPAEVPNGSAWLAFMVTPAGRVTNVKVVEGQGQRALVALSTKALLDCQLPPLSARVREALPERWGGNLMANLRFTQRPDGALVTPPAKEVTTQATSN